MYTRKTPEMDAIKIRRATIDDCDILYGFLKEIREFEGRQDTFFLTLEEFKRVGFGENKSFEACVVELRNNKDIIGCATYFFGFNGSCGRILLLDDIYFKPAYRSKGYGTALFRYMAKITVESGARRMEWCVPSWNSKAIEFYKKFNRIEKNVKQLYLQGEVLKKCAEF